MKKIATLFFFFLLFVLFYPKETTIPVFEENNDENNFSYYDIYPQTLTTQNFSQIFSGYEIISIEPKINPLLERQIQFQYTFTEDTIPNNIYSFTKKYIDLLQEHGFSKEISSLSIKGIPIKKATLFTTHTEYQRLSHLLE